MDRPGMMTPSADGNGTLLAGAPADWLQPPFPFIWASGIEDTFVPQTRARQRALDEYELMGHYQHWREDLALARDLGVQALRWGVPWYRVEPAPGEFDWTWIDQVIPYLVENLQISPIVDLMHYGCPLWLRGEFANPEYPRAVAAYAAAFASRYGHLVRWYTPLNEPLVNAYMCGRRGLWPPYLRGDGGYVRLLLQLAKGVVETVEAIKVIDPSAVMVHVEAAGIVSAREVELQLLALEEQQRAFLPYDLVTGRVTSTHPLFPWLMRHGASRHDLTGLEHRSITLDVLGLNFYPQWSSHELYFRRNGRLAMRAVPAQPSDFAEVLTRYYLRYGAPVMVTETSAHGDHATRSAWLETSLEAIGEVRSRAIPVIGYTWFPLFTMIDWRYRSGRLPVEDYRLDLGLYRLRENEFPVRWEATPLVEELQRHMTEPVLGPGRSATVRQAGQRAG